MATPATERLFAALFALCLVATACGGTTATEPETAASAADTTTDSDATTASASDTPTTTASSTEDTSDTASDLVVPELVGEFETLTGTPIDLETLQGQDVVLWFWAPW